MRWKNLKVSIYELKKAKEKGEVQKEHGENNNYKRKFSSFKDHILKIESFQTNNKKCYMRHNLLEFSNVNDKDGSLRGENTQRCRN